MSSAADEVNDPLSTPGILGDFLSRYVELDSLKPYEYCGVIFKILIRAVSDTMCVVQGRIGWQMGKSYLENNGRRIMAASDSNELVSTPRKCSPMTKAL